MPRASSQMPAHITMSMFASCFEAGSAEDKVIDSGIPVALPKHDHFFSRKLEMAYRGKLGLPSWGYVWNSHPAHSRQLVRPNRGKAT